MRHAGLQICGLAVSAVLLASAPVARGASIPVSESFEAFALGYDISGATDWSAIAGVGIVTNATVAIDALAAYTNAGGTFPLPDETHDKVLQISDALTYTAQSATGGVVVSDMLFMPAQRDEVPEGSTNYQFACYVNTNDQLVIWHRGTSSNEWLTLTGGPSIETGVWVRVAIRKDYTAQRYQVTIDGDAPISDAQGWSTASGGTHPGPWFDMVQTNGYMSRLRTEGSSTAYLDDLVFTQYRITYSNLTLDESISNDGSIDTSVTLSLAGDTFADVTPFVADTHYSMSGVPAGLTASITRDDATTLTLSLTGTATAHEGDDDTTLTLTFLDAAFTSVPAADVIDRQKTLTVDFINAPALTYSTSTFAETAANAGAVDGGTITLTDETFTGSAGTNYVLGGEVLVSNLPDGLTASIVKDSSTQVTVSFSGTANAHASANSINNLTFAFQDAAFSQGSAAAVSDATRADLGISFNDSPVVSYSGTTFTEAFANNGTISNSLTLTLTGETFADDGDFGAGDEYSTANVPDGLTLAAARDSDTQLTISLTGAATSHANTDDINNLTLSLLDAAFTAVAAANITNASRSDLIIDFNETVINTVPFRESFEDYAEGYTIGADEGWYPASVGTVTTETAIVSALTSAFDDFPLTTNHTQVLRLDDEISAEIRSGSGGTVYSDMMCYINAREEAPTGSTNYQCAIYVDTNQILHVWHRDTSGTPTNTWTVISGLTVTTSAWHRVTIEKDYAQQRFKLYLDGFWRPVANPTRSDSWFNMVGTANTYMSRLRVLGAGADAPAYLDDIHVDVNKLAFMDAGTIFRFR